MNYFKKTLYITMISILLIICLRTPSYAKNSDTSLIICINEEFAYVNNTVTDITSPKLICDKTYIDVFEFAKLLNVNAEKENNQIILTYKNKEEELNEIKYWDELNNSESVFFCYEGSHYVSLRSFADFVELNILYNDGIIEIGHNPKIIDDNKYFPNKNISESDYMVYEKYGHYILLTPNSNIAAVDGEQKEISSPVIIFDKVYISLDDISSALGIATSMSKSGNITAAFDESTINLSPIKYWDEIHFNNKYLLINNKIYVPLREFSEALGHNIFFNNWVIGVGYSDKSDGNNYLDYDNINTANLNDYLYNTYPYNKTYTVNPYIEYSYENMLDDAKNLKQMYPDLIELSSIGQSVEGRELLLMKLGKGKKKIFVCGTHHAREYICTTYLMYAIDRYAYSYATTGFWNNYNVKQILDNVTFYIVPMVNPDGVNLVQNGVYATKNPEYIKSMSINEGAKYGYAAWKANVNGVDVNWNYNKDWTYERTKGPRGSTGFNGTQPNSEPETIAMTNYINSIPFDAFISFHSQGKLIYYCDDINKPSGLDKLLKNETGFSMYYEKRTGVGGSFFDYVARKFGKVTTTFELCPFIGNYPYPNSDFDTVWKPTQNVLLVFGNYYQYIN